MASKQERGRRELRYTDTASFAQRQLEKQASGGDIRIPDGVTLLKVEKEGTYNLDIIPFVVGKNAFMIDAGNKPVEPGDLHWEFSYWQHVGVGPEEMGIACLRNWGEKCPLCERAQAFRRTMQDTKEDKKTFSFMKAKLRSLLNVIETDAKKPELQLFAYSWFGFTKQLLNKLASAAGDSRLADYLTFWHLEKGRTVQARMSETDMGNWLQASNIELLPRRDDLPDSLIDDAVCLDELLIKRTYDEIVAIADGEPMKADRNGHDTGRRVSSSVSGPHLDSREEGTPIKRNVVETERTRREEPEDLAAKMGIEVNSYVMYEETRCRVVKINRDGTRVDLEEDESRELIKGVKVEECEVAVDDDEPRPARRGREPEPERKPAGRGRKDDDEDEGWRSRGRKDEPEEEPEPEPAPKRGPGRPRKS